MEAIKIVGPDRLLLNGAGLGTSEAWLWIGAADGPSDDDDERVRREREEALKNPPTGEDGKLRPFGIEAVRLRRSTSDPDWYEIDTSEWSAGIYRFNAHGDANEATPFGTLLDPSKRDLEYSWYGIGDLEALSAEQRAFIYKENNGRGFCFRIELMPQRGIVAAGNLS